MVQEDLVKYKDTFLSEAKEHVASMNKALLKFEKHPAKLEPVNDIFRHMHTLKSMSAAMDYEKMSQLCHAIEDILDAIRKKRVKPDACVDILFECFDMLDLTLKELKRNKEETDTAVLVEKLQKIASADNADKKSVDYTDKSTTSTEVEKIESIEVKVEKLDLLMNLAEELLINKMRLDRIKEDIQNPELNAAMDALGRIVTDMQYNIMQSRMVPIGFVFNRFPRIVRDLAKSQKKEINLEMEGSDIELDRGVIDEIGESLVHLIRNAVDHGMETPDVRKKAGKPAQGTIKLTAKRAKGLAVIEVSDDGGGLDIEDIKNTAIKRGVISSGATKEEIIASIFSGVSTTKQVTQVSGRGFGLNIVKEKIESIGGSIKIASAKDAKETAKDAKKGFSGLSGDFAPFAVTGTTFRIEIPLTLAIIKSLFVDVGGKPYALPLVNIARLVTVNQKDIKGMLNYEALVLEETPHFRVGNVRDYEGYHRRKPVEEREEREDIPITRLRALFGLPPSDLEKQPIAIVRKGGERLGLAVDTFMSTEEIVIKPLNRLVKENKYFAGSTIIGSGEVVLILDVTNLMLTKRGLTQTGTQTNTD